MLFKIKPNILSYLNRHNISLLSELYLTEQNVTEYNVTEQNIIGLSKHNVS